MRRLSNKKKKNLKEKDKEIEELRKLLGKKQKPLTIQRFFLI